MINTLQFILHVPLLSIPLPPNVMTFFKALFNVITFDFINTDPKIQAVFALKDDDSYPPYNDKFDLLGYSTSNTLYNVGLPVFGILLYFGLLLLYLIVRFLPFKIAQKITKKLRKMIFWNPALRFVIELALEGVLSSVVNIRSYIIKDTELNNIGEIMTVLLSIALIVLNIVFAILITCLLIKHRNDLEPLEKYFSEFTENQRTLWTAQLFFQGIFVLRRFTMVGIVFLLSPYATI
jgi:hypothetical protein